MPVAIFFTWLVGCVVRHDVHVEMSEQWFKLGVDARLPAVWVFYAVVFSRAHFTRHTGGSAFWGQSGNQRGEEERYFHHLCMGTQKQSGGLNESKKIISPDECWVMISKKKKMVIMMLVAIILLFVWFQLKDQRHTMHAVELGPMKTYHLLKPEKRGFFDIHLQDLDYYVDRGMLPGMSKRDIQKVRWNMDNFANMPAENAYDTAVDVKRFFLRAWGQYDAATKPEKPKEKRYFIQLHTDLVMAMIEEPAEQTVTFGELLQPADIETVTNLMKAYG